MVEASFGMAEAGTRTETQGAREEPLKKVAWKRLRPAIGQREKRLAADS